MSDPFATLVRGLKEAPMQTLWVVLSFAVAFATLVAFGWKSREVARARVEERERQIADLKERLGAAVEREGALRSEAQRAAEERAATRAALEAERRSTEEKLRL